MLGIIQAESQGWPDAENPVSTASGLFQFLDSTAQTYCVNKYQVMVSLEEKNDPFKQIDCAVLILKEPRGYTHWLASMSSWRHLLTGV